MKLRPDKIDHRHPNGPGEQSWYLYCPACRQTILAIRVGLPEQWGHYYLLTAHGHPKEANVRYQFFPDQQVAASVYLLGGSRALEALADTLRSREHQDQH